ncbi:hypothetical protein [Kocuria rosea]|uniref:hypothetical protein n=1 Tax=Kocuria rosea TaxID=1275 RepID=UPI00119D2FE5|nr:hypothetical protein [Kocuria rosea]
MTTKATTTKTTQAPATKPTACRCGCGLPTITAEARYRPGHDARHAGNLIRAWADAADDSEARQQITEAAARELATPGLQAKFERGIARVQRIATERAERQAQREAERTAKAA